MKVCGTKNWDILVLSILGLVATLVICAIAGTVQEYISAKLGVQAIGELRQSLFNKLQNLPTGSLDKLADGDVANRFSGDLNAIEIAFVRSIPVIIMQFLLVIFSLIALFIIEWRLAIMAVITMPLIGVASMPFNKRSETAMKERAAFETSVVGLAQENYTARLVVRLFRLQQERAARFTALAGNLRDSGAKAHFFTGLIARSALMASGVMLLVIIGVGAYLAFNDYMTTGLLIAFIGILLNIGDAVTHLSTAIPLLSIGSASMGRVDAILEQDAPADSDGTGKPMPPLTNGIRFYAVGFSYDGETQALSEISFTIKAGEKVALVGPSGCGKSTVLSLIMRLYAPGSGAITYDDAVLGEIDETELRRHMSVVPQTPILFDASIAENIRLGNPDADDQAMRTAAEQAAILTTIEDLPEKFDTRVGAGGGNLSGGQRQRISIARAFLKNAPLLLLDEATSALDPGSEEEVNNAILDWPMGTTIVSVTHRLSSVTDFDRILVFEKGRLVEQGPHQDLLAAGGLYRELWDKQNGFAVDAENDLMTVTAEQLKAIPFLADCDEATLAEMADYFASERVIENRTIFEAGDPGDDFYVVARGSLEVFVPTPDGGEISVGSLSDGDFFGEIALVEDRPRTASVRAKTDSVCLSLPRQHFVRLMEAHPGLEQSIRTTIEERLASTGEALGGEG